MKKQWGAGILSSEHRRIVSGAAEEGRQVAPSVRECVCAAAGLLSYRIDYPD